MRPSSVVGVITSLFSLTATALPSGGRSGHETSHSNKIARDGAITQALPQSAIDAMNGYYNDSDGRWSSAAAWWLSGNALQAVLDYMNATNTRVQLDRARHTIDLQRASLAWWPQGGGDFRAQSTDDTGWWALAMVRMYDLTSDEKYLDIAREDADYMHNYWDASSCGGGIIQEISPPNGQPGYKNAISNSLYIKLHASLANRLSVESDRNTYKTRAGEGWDWFKNSGIINGDNLVNDGINPAPACANNGQTTWTYNQGVILGALAELSRATGDRTLLDAASRIADAVVVSGRGGLTTKDGILRETCEGNTGDAACNGDQAAFKGIFARNLAELNAVLDGKPYRDFLVKNAQSVVGAAGDGRNNYGLKWAGPFEGSDIGKQSSAVGLLVAAMG